MILYGNGRTYKRAFTTQCKLVKIEEQNWFIDAWRHDTTVRGCISTLETIDRKFGSNDAVKCLKGLMKSSITR